MNNPRILTIEEFSAARMEWQELYDGDVKIRDTSLMGELYRTWYLTSKYHKSNNELGVFIRRSEDQKSRSVGLN